MHSDNQDDYPTWARKRKESHDFGDIELSIAAGIIGCSQFALLRYGQWPFGVSTTETFMLQVLMFLVFVRIAKRPMASAAGFGAVIKEMMLPTLVVALAGYLTLIAFGITEESAPSAWKFADLLLRYALWTNFAMVIGGSLTIWLDVVLKKNGLRASDRPASETASAYLESLPETFLNRIKNRPPQQRMDFRRWRLQDVVMAASQYLPVLGGAIGFYVLKDVAFESAVVAGLIAVAYLVTAEKNLRTLHIVPRKWFPPSEGDWPTTIQEYKALKALVYPKVANTELAPGSRTDEQ